MSLGIAGINGKLTIDQGTELDLTLTGAEVKQMKDNLAGGPSGRLSLL